MFLLRNHILYISLCLGISTVTLYSFGIDNTLILMNVPIRCKDVAVRHTSEFRVGIKRQKKKKIKISFYYSVVCTI